MGEPASADAADPFGTNITTEGLQMEPEDNPQPVEEYPRKAAEEDTSDGKPEEFETSGTTDPLLARNTSKSGKKQKKKKGKPAPRASSQKLDEPDKADSRGEQSISFPDSEEPKAGDLEQSIPNESIEKDAVQHPNSKVKGKGKKKRAPTDKSSDASAVEIVAPLPGPGISQPQIMEGPSWSIAQGQEELDLSSEPTRLDVSGAKPDSNGKSKPMRAQSSNKKGKKKRRGNDSWMDEVETQPVTGDIDSSHEPNDRERDSTNAFNEELTQQSATQDGDHRAGQGDAAEVEQITDMRETTGNSVPPGAEETTHEQSPRSLSPEMKDAPAESENLPDDLDELFPHKRNKKKGNRAIRDGVDPSDPEFSDPGSKKKKGGKARKDRKVTKGAEKSAQPNVDSNPASQYGDTDEPWETGKSKKKNKKRDAQILAIEKPDRSPADADLDSVTLLPAKSTGKAEKKRKGKKNKDRQDSEDESFRPTESQKPDAEESAVRAVGPEVATAQEIAAADVTTQQSRQGGEDARYPDTAEGEPNEIPKTERPSEDIGIALNPEAEDIQPADKLGPQGLSQPASEALESSEAMEDVPPTSALDGTAASVSPPDDPSWVSRAGAIEKNDAAHELSAVGQSATAVGTAAAIAGVVLSEKFRSEKEADVDPNNLLREDGRPFEWSTVQNSESRIGEQPADRSIDIASSDTQRDLSTASAYPRVHSYESPPDLINPSDVPLPLDPVEPELPGEPTEDLSALRARSDIVPSPGMPPTSAEPIAVDTTSLNSSRSDQVQSQNLEFDEGQDQEPRSSERSPFSLGPITGDDFEDAQLTSSPEPMDIEPENEAAGEFEATMQPLQMPPGALETQVQGEQGHLLEESPRNEYRDEAEQHVISAHPSAKSTTADVSRRECEDREEEEPIPDPQPNTAAQVEQPAAYDPPEAIRSGGFEEASDQAYDETDSRSNPVENGSGVLDKPIISSGQDTGDAVLEPTAARRDSRSITRGTIELAAAVAAGLQDAGFDPSLALQDAPFVEPHPARKLEEPDFDDIPQHSSMKSSRRGSRRQSRAQSLDRSEVRNMDFGEDIGRAITTDGPDFEALLAASLEHAGFDAKAITQSDERETDETDMEISAMRQRSHGWNKTSTRAHSPASDRSHHEASHSRNSSTADESAAAGQEHDRRNFGLGVTHVDEGLETPPAGRHRDEVESDRSEVLQPASSAKILPLEGGTGATPSASQPIHAATKQSWSLPENRDSAIAMDESPRLPDLEPSLSRDRDSGFQDYPRTPDSKRDYSFGTKSKRSSHASPKSPIQVQVDVVDDWDVTVSQGSHKLPAANPAFESPRSSGRSFAPPAVEPASADRADTLPFPSAEGVLFAAANLQSSRSSTAGAMADFASAKHPLTESEADEREAKVPRTRSSGRRHARISQAHRDQLQSSSPSSKSSTEELNKRRAWPSIAEEDAGPDGRQTGLDSQSEDRSHPKPRHISSRDGLRSPASSRSIGSYKGEGVGKAVSPTGSSRDRFPFRNPRSAELLATAATVGAIVGASSRVKTRSPGMEGLYVSLRLPLHNR
jgi:hypothetical protein